MREIIFCRQKLAVIQNPAYSDFPSENHGNFVLSPWQEYLYF
jgi:hypothetical protein